MYFLYRKTLLLIYQAFKLTTSLESTVPEWMLTISVSQKLDMSIKESTVNQKVFLFLSVLLKLEYNPHGRYFSNSIFLIPKKYKSISDIINILVLETAGWNHRHEKRKDKLETRAAFSWISILTWNFGSNQSNSASNFSK